MKTKKREIFVARGQSLLRVADRHGYAKYGIHKVRPSGVDKIYTLVSLGNK